MSYNELNKRSLSIINAYLNYFMGNLPKKILLLGIVLYLSRVPVESGLISFILFYLGYLSIYFANDFIDREEDKKRRYIAQYKLLLSKKQLFYLAMAHLVIPNLILIIINPFVGILSLTIDVFGILRSYIRKLILRELSLGLLQIMQLYLIFLIYNSGSIFFNNLLFIISFAILYSFTYYLHKIPDKGGSSKKTIFYIILYVSSILLALPEVSDIIMLAGLFSGFIVIIYSYLRFSSRNLSSTMFQQTLISGNILFAVFGLALILLGQLHVAPAIDIHNTVYFMKYLVIANQTIKKTILYACIGNCM